jgi:hypothetical protein
MKYLTKFKKSTYRKLFKLSMPTETLGEIIDVLSASVASSSAAKGNKLIEKVLENIAEIPSMSFTLTLLPEEQQQKLKVEILPLLANSTTGGEIPSVFKSF